MEFIAITLANLIWIMYSLTEGIREGFFVHYKNKSRRESRFTANKIFNLQRLLVLLATGSILCYITGYYGILFMIGQLFMFRYFHKIAYDKTTKKIDHKILDEEDKSIILDLSTKVKAPLLFFGVTIQIFIYIFLM
jgi:hypothetical protein